MSRVMTSSGAAQVLGVSVATVLALAKRGDLPAARTPTGLHLFLREDVERVATERARRRRR